MVGPSVAAMGLVFVGHSAWIEHIVANYTIVMVPGYTVVVPPFVADVQTETAL